MHGQSDDESRAPESSARESILSLFKEMSAEELLQSLFVVSRLSVNDKLVSDGLRFSIRQPSYYRILVRMYFNENRGKNIDALRMVFQLSMKGVLLHSYKCEIAEKIRFLDALIPACNGLKNLIETYREDVETVSRLQILVDEVQDFVQTHQESKLDTQSSQLNKEVSLMETEEDEI